MTNSTFLGNSARELGGGIGNWGTMIVSNCTFSANNASQGGGVGNAAHGKLTVINSTFSRNSASSGAAILGCCEVGGVVVKNTILANNLIGQNCNASYESDIMDGGGNLSYPDTTCPGINIDPKLGPLQNNGAPTATMALLAGSGAIDAADDTTCAAPPVNNRDQRGYHRPAGTHCDIGAYELFVPNYLPVIMK